MRVKARPGTMVPFENDPRKHITDSAAVEVPASSYYRRLIKDGSLVIDEAKAKGAAANKGGERS